MISQSFECTRVAKVPQFSKGWELGTEGQAPVDRIATWSRLHAITTLTAEESKPFKAKYVVREDFRAG